VAHRRHSTSSGGGSSISGSWWASALDTIVLSHLNQPRELVQAQAVTELFA
jgi:hypothetical protein